ncbi:hypothetical protein A8C56_13545 [Niabella ginsenosidivorans]|uniref:Uncharacterized protein n=1 Tax=Niabella ginsenosidivorans TaxID=1176587 RepID=A0A1A9I5A2_9BACT|nr:hypothetical protein A8C56_13545 [Niabella ginsenosidivorans]
MAGVTERLLQLKNARSETGLNSRMNDGARSFKLKPRRKRNRALNIRGCFFLCLHFTNFAAVRRPAVRVL